MAEMQAGESGAPVAAEAVVDKKKGISGVWIVPIVAALVGLFLVWKTFTQEGPTITVSFNSAAGITVGKTKVRFRAVDIGVVEDIEIAENLQSVDLKIKMDKGTGPYLRDDTKFWVVKPRIVAGEIQGLDTLTKGAYIAIEPSEVGQKRRKFRGLERPPLVTAGDAGSFFRLRADSKGGLGLGSPVFFRQIEVGRVTDVELDESGEFVNFLVFVDAPHDDRITRTTRFWNAGGVDFTLDANGVQIETTSFVTMLLGGIEFDTPVTMTEAQPADEDFVFRLYSSQRDSQRQRFEVKEYYLVYFTENVRGLVPGAPVEFRGLKIGEVLDVRLVFDLSTQDVEVPVLLEIEPERIVGASLEPDDPEDLREAVLHGLRARLKAGNLLTGRRVIDFDFYPDAPEANVDFSQQYPVLPVMPSPLAGIAEGMASIVGKLNEMPLEQIGKNLETASAGLGDAVGDGQLADSIERMAVVLANLEQVSADFKGEITPQMAETLRETQMTMEELRRGLAAGSPLRQEMRRLLVEMADAAQSIRLLTDYLERNPESLVFGKKRENQE